MIAARPPVQAAFPFMPLSHQIICATFLAVSQPDGSLPPGLVYSPTMREFLRLGKVAGNCRMSKGRIVCKNLMMP
jgi:hypothetical protein